MDVALKQLVDLANELLKKAEIGREYTMEYVIKRLDDALNDYPHDPVINSVARVINKQYEKGKATTSQKELYSTYNHFAGLSGNSMIKEAIGDILYPVELPKPVMNNNEQFALRSNDKPLDVKIQYNPLENIFDKNVAMGSYYDPTLAKLGKHAITQELSDIGVPATDIKVVAGIDNKAIVYNVAFTNKLGKANIPVFVEVENGVQAPTHFYFNDQFIQLTAENLNKAIVEKATEVENNEVIIPTMNGVITTSAVLSPNFEFDKIQAPIKENLIPVPEAIKNLVEFDRVALEANSYFSSDMIKAAKAICVNELSKLGFKSQVGLSEATDNCIICSAELNSSVGKVEIKLPVEVINNRPQIPAVFYNEANKDKIYDFSRADLSSYLTALKTDNANQIMRYSNDFFNMNYAQLKEEILNGVANKDYTRAEQALNRIEDRFGSEYHRTALSDYAKFLSFASKKDTTDETANHKCRLLIRKGSVEPRCGHYNVPLHRVATDDKGNCELLERKAKYENLANGSVNTGVSINTSKIVLT